VADEKAAAPKSVVVQLSNDTEHGFWVGVAGAERGKRGILVASHDRWNRGDAANVTLHLAGVSKPLNLVCKAAFYVPDPGVEDASFGVGLAFTAMKPEQQTVLKNYFAKKKPDLYQWNADAGSLERTSRIKKAPAGPKKLTLMVGPDTEHGLWVGFMEDIAEGGIFYSTQDRFTIGDPVDLDLHLSTRRGSLACKCVVRWVREDSGFTGAGAGLGWEGELPGKHLKALQAHIKKAKPELIFWDE